MLQKFVDEILAAESEAEKITEDAEAQAVRIKQSLETAVDEKREQFSASQKAIRAEAYSEAEKKAESLYLEALSAADKEAAGILTATERKTGQAVGLILEYLRNN
jgi:vacuolar-type H+-ATPase subunit E/Vma4